MPLHFLLVFFGPGGVLVCGARRNRGNGGRGTGNLGRGTIDMVRGAEDEGRVDGGG